MSRNERKWFKHFTIKQYHQIELIQEGGRPVITLKAWKNIEQDKENSLKIRYAKKDEEMAKAHLKILKDLHKMANEILKPTRGHEGHEIKKFIHEIHENKPEEHRKCGQCGNYLLGKLLRGIRCIDHGQVYHEECFKSGISENIPCNDEGSERHADMIVPVDSVEPYDAGCANQQEARKLLHYSEHGTFLLRYSERSQQYVVSVKEEEDIIHYKIDQEELDDITYYSLVTGDAKTDLFALIEQHRKSHQLFVPYKLASNARTVSNPVQSNEYDEVEEEGEEIYYDPGTYVELEESSEEEEQEYKGPSLEDYNYGNMSRQEAMKLLEGTRDGTFLIRYSEEKDSLILSRTPSSSGSKVTNIILYRGSQEEYYFVRSQKFQSIEELVQHYQSVEFDHKYWLGEPLMKNQATGNI